MDRYRNEHKIILQTVMHEGALHEDRVRELVIRLFDYRQISDHNNTARVLSEINAKLRPLYMTVKRINCELTGQLYWIFTSTVQDKIASFHPEFSQAELDLLRNVYSEIVTSNNGCVSSTFCLNLCSTLDQKLTKTDGEEFLNKMVNRKWLCRKDGKFYMGVRSIGELLQYFKDTYENNLQICTLCKQELFHGEKCEKCDAITHVYCLENYTRNGGLGCPNCHHSTSRLNAGDNASAMDIENLSYMTIESGEMFSQEGRKSKRKHKD